MYYDYANSHALKMVSNLAVDSGTTGKVQLERESLQSIEVVKRASLLIFTDRERNPLTEGKIER